MICAFCIGGDSGEYCSETCREAAEVKFCLAGGDMAEIATVATTLVKEWRMDGALHRKDGPALEYSDGRKSWYQRGRRIRVEGHGPW